MARVLLWQQVPYMMPSFMSMPAVLKQYGHTCDVVVSGRYGKVVAKIKKGGYQILGTSIMRGEHRTYLEGLRVIKTQCPDIKSIVGGIYPTVFPECIANEGVDAVCVGEGEYPLLEFAEMIDKGGFSEDICNLINKRKDGTVVRNPLRPYNDLDRLPFMDYQLYRGYPYIFNDTTKIFCSSKGCPYQCSFCYNSTINNIFVKNIEDGKVFSHVRYKSVDRMIEEIKFAKSQMLIRTVRNLDDTLTINKKRFLEFIEKFRALGLAIVFFCRANEIDEDIAYSLKDIPCTPYFSVESGDEEVRSRILQKRLRDEDILRAGAILKKHNIQFAVSLLTGFPGETIESLSRTIEFCIKLRPDITWFNIFTPFVKLTLTDRAIEEGLLDKDFMETTHISFYEDIALKWPKKFKDKMTNLHRLASFLVRFPSFYQFKDRMIGMPRNPFFQAIHDLMNLYQHQKKYFRGFWENFVFAIMIKYYLWRDKRYRKKRK